MAFKGTTIIPFNYFGGKYTHAQFVIDNLIRTKSFVDVFGGSGIILLNINPPYPIETLNDVDGDVVNFFNVLRNHTNELLEKIYFTPYSRAEYQTAFKYRHTKDPIENARRFFIMSVQSFNGTKSRQTGWKMATKESRATIAESISRWLSKFPHLESTVERLRRVQITNYDFRIIFEKFKHKNSLLYCDPPYMHEVRCNDDEYVHEMTVVDHIELLNLCITHPGYIAISGYKTDLYMDMLKGFYVKKAKAMRTGLSHSSRQEYLWTNYDPDLLNKNLFNQ